MQHRHHRGTLCRVEGPPQADAGDSRFTMRLRLEPVGPANAPDLWLVHNDDEVSYWYDNEKPSLEQAEQRAKFMGDSWRFHGVHKWIAYDRVSGEVAGRGGLSRTPVDDDWVRSTHSFRRSRGCASRMRFAAHSLRTRTGSRSDGRYGASSGGAATRLRSGAPGWRLHSTSSGCKPWCRARSVTTCVRAP